MKRFCVTGALAALFAVAGVGPAGAQQPVVAGIDLLETNIGDTFEDLSQLDFLCTGCQVIGEPQIQLRGVPLDESAACPGELGNTDTIVRRLDDTPPLEPGQEAFVQIQIVALQLRSVEPFQVDCNGEIQNWMLDVTVNPADQPLGQMRIQKDHPNGGFFDSNLPVAPILTFTRVDACPPAVVCQVDAPVVIFQTQGAPWAHQPTQGPVLEIPGCTSNFLAGVDPFGGSDPARNNPGFQEAQMLRAHGVLPPLPPKLSQQTWQDAVHFTFSLENPGGKFPGAIDALRLFNPRAIPMHPGGMPDDRVYFKSNSICNTDPLWTASPSAWCRVNWDPDDPLFRDEAWWFFQPVPVGSMAPEMDLVFSVPPPDPCLPPPSGIWYEVDVECYRNCQSVDFGRFRFHCDADGTVTTPESTGPIQIERILKQNVPNPFNPTTTIGFTLPQSSRVKLTIYNIQGEVVRSLLDESRGSGDHSVRWDGADDNGNKVASGAYFYEIQADGVKEARKMVILK